MSRIIGTCGRCGGPVKLPDMHGLPACVHCGAKTKPGYGPVLQMEDDKPVRVQDGRDSDSNQPPNSPLSPAQRATITDSGKGGNAVGGDPMPPPAPFSL